MNPEPIISRSTLKTLAKIGIVAAVLLLAIWIIGFGRDTLAKSGKSKRGGGDLNPDGTPEPLPGLGVDKAYIDRIAKIGKGVSDAKSYEGFDGDRCEFINNVAQMRDEEILALSVHATAQYGYDIRALINRCKSNGCYSFGDETLEQAKGRIRNF